MRSDVVDYELIGDDMQMVVITLDPGEAVLAEAGAMCYMTAGIDMDTRMDPHGEGGLFGSLFKAGKRHFEPARGSGLRRALPRQDHPL
jgi:uncharacterized protein (AIM24 family)